MGLLNLHDVGLNDIIVLEDIFIRMGGRIEWLEGQHDGAMKGIEARFTELEARVERIERLLNHKEVG